MGQRDVSWKLEQEVGLKSVIRAWGINMKGAMGSKTSKVGKYKLCKWKL